MKQPPALLAAALAAACAAAQSPSLDDQKPAPAPFALMVGDAAPAMHIAEWLQGESVTSFAPDQTYVVEFWATWCGPCIKNMPHLSELQEQHGDKATVIGVSVWEDDVERVRPFFQKNRDNMRYTVAREALSGDKGRMAEAWMAAAGRRGIPCAFIVDGAKIAWIGHPVEMDQPLAEIVAGEWDLESATRDYARKMARVVAQREIESRLNPLRKDGKTAAAYEVALELGEMNPAAAANAMNLLAWDVVDPEREMPASDADIALAIKIASTARELSGSDDPFVLDTLATALFAGGQIDAAIEVQVRALSLAAPDGQLIKDIRARLKQFRAARAAPDGQ
ncbi:MAG: TlpA disulfide reductase family protein [Planctomycetota bacterium]